MIQELAQQNKSLLEQLKQVLQQFSLDNYTAKLPILFNSSISMHVRHVLEFYECFCNGKLNGIINYDARQRNHKIESSLEYTLENIIALQDLLDDCKVDATIQLCANSMEEDTLITMNSSISRELYYLLEHTTHHMAIIKMATMANFSTVEFSSVFGIAQSTLQYQKKCAQ